MWVLHSESLRLLKLIDSLRRLEVLGSHSGAHLEGILEGARVAIDEVNILCRMKITLIGVDLLGEASR